MKGKLYTKVHKLADLGLQETRNSVFTPEEHSLVVKKEMGQYYRSREDLLNHALSKNFRKLETFPFVVDFVRNNKIRNILSIGAGDCSLEHLLAYCLSDIPDLKIFATEFDDFLVSGARQYYHNIRVEKYDLFRDDLPSFQSTVGVKFDLVIFYGSAYVMDNALFIRQFKQFLQTDVQYILDFHAGYLSFASAWKTFAFEIVNRLPALKRFLATILCRKVSSGYSSGKFHGYWRDRIELAKLYRRSGWKKIKSFRLPNSYTFIGVLSR